VNNVLACTELGGLEMDVHGFGDQFDLEVFYANNSLSDSTQIKAAVIFNEDCDFANGQNYTIGFPIRVMENVDKLFPPRPGLGKNWRGPTLG